MAGESQAPGLGRENESPVYREPPRGPETDEGDRAPRWPLIFLLLPFVGLLYPPWYDNIDPTLAGIPFFVWYQFVWVIAGAILTYLAYRLREPRP
ncbi:MAG TPA: DUF3311 domain-containing protein [Gaiellaceae bacterium]|jgi:hypothetical protein